MRCSALLAGILAAAQVVAYPTVHLESTVERVPVLELFTSHGCSSCPPVDTWLRSFVQRPGLWREVVPLSFHVDYWDKLGWPDRFAAKRYSQRQQDYRAAGSIRSVYTPGLVVNGREWRGWFRGGQPDLSQREKVGKLSLDLDGSGVAVIRFDPSGRKPAGKVLAHLAVLGFGLSTPIGRGENAGRTLKEDFVVLGYRSTAPAKHGRQWDLELPKTVPAETSRLAVAAWISAGIDPAPVQAVAGWMP